VPASLIDVKRAAPHGSLNNSTRLSRHRALPARSGSLEAGGTCRLRETTRKRLPQP